jgi:nicotinate-nucleotide adenylyltransferase
VCDAEARRGGASFTVDTLRELDAENQELTFIVGGDMALSLSTWREPAEILRLARLGIAERGEARRELIEQALAPLGAADRFAFFTMPRIDLSSTALRARVAAGRSIRHRVPDAVADAIAQRGLYR